MYEINLKSTVPIYMQIVESTRDNLLKGILREGDKLPSVRELAKILLVNESTIQRAYRELENLGIIKTIVGRGTFIDFDLNKKNLDKLNVEKKLEEVLKEALYHNISKEEINNIYDKLNMEVKDNAKNI